jgi:hypothetical protein
VLNGDTGGTHSMTLVVVITNFASVCAIHSVIGPSISRSILSDGSIFYRRTSARVEIKRIHRPAPFEVGTFDSSSPLQPDGCNALFLA